MDWTKVINLISLIIQWYPKVSAALKAATGGPIAWVQEGLNLVDNAGLTVDGINGPKTHAAIVAFQEKHGLTPDGIPGLVFQLVLGSLHL